MKSSTWTRAWLLAGIVVCGTALISLSEKSSAEDAKTETKADAEKAAATKVDILPEPGYGTLKGQFVLNGAIPKFEAAGKPSDANGGDIKLCGGETVPSQALVVDPASKGIANIFVYLQKAPTKIHPSLEKAPTNEILFDQKICQFLPRNLIVRVGQPVRILSDDPVTHNTHTHPFRNTEFNQTIPPKERKGVELKFSAVEKRPVGVGCDIHRWMQSWWLVLDHPYAAITDAEGKFAIGKIPAGEYEFIVWQETSGYVVKKFTVTIPDNGTLDKGVTEVPVAMFAPKN
jgi:plastocyanin